MKKINSVKWKRFLDSAEGKEAIDLFRKATASECSSEELLALAKKYNSEYFRNFGSIEANALEGVKYFRELVAEYMEEENPVTDTAEDLYGIYVQITFKFLLENFAKEIKKDLGDLPEELSLEDIPQKYYKQFLAANFELSLALYNLGLGNFLPNLFVTQFALMKRFAENYELEVPETPNRSDYLGRCLYYMDLCDVLVEFFAESGIDDEAEICAYLFAYEFPEIKGELESEQRPMPEQPEQIWLLVGNRRGDEKTMTRGFWQGSPLTRRGDLCLFYEKSPIKAMNAAWIAQEDGVVDPFFLFYSNTYIGNRIEIPAIPFEEFKNSEYFTKLRIDEHGKALKGNYVSKNFQDCSGWPITRADYEEIQKMLRAKGFDTTKLPQLPKYEPLVGVNIKEEADVTEQLLMPLLDRMGYKFKKDYFREVEFTAGHGETGYGLDKRPDVCLHMTGSGKNIGSQVVIEMKLDMSSAKKLEDAFVQGLSYAKYGEARIYCLADQEGIYVFQRDNEGKFTFKNKEHYTWEQMSDNDKYIELKRLFEKK